MPTSTSTIKSFLKKTIDSVCTDEPYGPSDLKFTQYMQVLTQEDNWEDDQEVAGPATASEKPEGQVIKVGEITEGVPYRYLARTFAIQIIVTSEALEDNKYGKAIDAAMCCKTALFKAAELDAVQLLERGFNSAYAYGDGVELWDSAHPLPSGGTFSNIFATALPPTVAAFSQARLQAEQMPGHHGVTEGYMVKKVVCPADLRSAWERIIHGKLDTDAANNFSRPNVAQRADLELCVNPYWQNSTTNYAFVTDAPNGLKFKWRRKAKSHSWDGNDQMTMHASVSARWDWGHSNPRATIGVNA